MKSQFKNKKAFTLIELLIVIAIIGILFIVLVSKVDFATDKAKATGVQTDFRSFQVALDTVAKENAGFNTFGFNTGDNADAIPVGYEFETEALKNATIGDGIRNSYDKGDKNLNGKQDVNGVNGYTGTTEVWTGGKIYTENWTEVYTLTKPGTTGLDANAVFALESAINANLDPKLHITINAADGTIAMANQARDPWKNEYHGVYISKAERDGGADRGAIIIYSNGANGKWGSEHDITNGVVSVIVPGNNTYGKDDYSIVSCYTFTNGYGEVLNMSTGFSNNQNFMASGNNSNNIVNGGDATEGTEETKEIIFDKTVYATLQEAVDAAESGNTIKLLEDISDETITIDKNITISGSVSAHNVSINADGADEVTISGLSFTGNSWVNSGTAEKLTIKGVTANVTPSNAAQTNSRSAFISLGRSESQELELTVENCYIAVKGGGANPILGWASITKANISQNIIDSQSGYAQYSDSIKFMGIANDAVINITDNTIYSDYNGIILGQNSTRNNAYTVNIDGNTFIGGADHIWVEVSGSNTVHATINATSNNTVNGNVFVANDIKVHPNVQTWTSYAGVDIVKDGNDKVIGGKLAYYDTSVIAENYQVNGNGEVVAK